MTNFNNLVPVTETTINGKLQQTVSAKQLHAFLNVGRDFSNWIKGRIAEYGFTLDEDYINCDSQNWINISLNNEQLTPNLAKKPQRGRPEKDYILTIGTAKELAMIENNEQGRAIRKYFIRCEEQLKEVAPIVYKKEVARLKARIEVASYSIPMRDALQIQRALKGKETKPHHFSNEFNMINNIVIGAQAHKYKKANNLTGNIRDQFNEQTLSHIAYLEKSNTTLIEIGLSYEQRKTKLTELSNRYLTKQLEGVAQ